MNVCLCVCECVCVCVCVKEREREREKEPKKVVFISPRTEKGQGGGDFIDFLLFL